MSLPSQEVQAIEKLAPRKFHRIFTAPDTDRHGPLKVSYAIAGVDVDERERVPTILFCGGMFGTRYIAPWFDWLAQTEGVRMILIDRFVGALSCWIFSYQLPSISIWGFLLRFIR